MKLPSYVQKLSPETTARYQTVYDTALEKSREEAVASIAANQWLQRHMQTQYVALNTKVRSVVRFNVDTSTEFIKRTDSGDEYIDAMLQDIHGDIDGRQWTPEVLQMFADKINRGEQIVGDLDHVEYDRILSSAMSDREVEERFRQKKGLAKSVKARYQDGQLWIRALIDKRYKRMLEEKSKGISIEAVVTKDDEGRVVDGKLLGWTFLVDAVAPAANPRAQFEAV